MRQFLAAAALALTIATPAFAQVSPDYPPTDPLSSTPRIRAEQEWWRLVAKTNAYRLGVPQEQQLPASQDAAISSGGSATDAGMAAYGTSPSLVTGANTAAGCPGTNDADQPWHAGEYCLPGGR